MWRWALSALLLVVATVDAVDRSTFKTCEQATFC
uniref:Uncharacterized protein n=1 Tax=Plectus sambesii TaxID=2011161 RepID=A0A914VP19_9BILA